MARRGRPLRNYAARSLGDAIRGTPEERAAEAAQREQPEGRMETDEELGIGEEDEPTAVKEPGAPEGVAALTALLRHPTVAALIEDAVAARLAAATPASVADGHVKAIADAVERLALVHAAQQPGYQKPIPQAELERRAAGYVEMTALIEDCRSRAAQGQRSAMPLYTLLDDLYAGDILFVAGEQIRTLIPPNEQMQPENEAAERVFAAMLQWIGGKQPDIGERLAEEMAGRKNAIFGTPGTMQTAPVELVERAPGDTRRQVGASRTLGTVVPEPKRSTETTPPSVRNAATRLPPQMGSVLPHEAPHQAQGI